MKHMNIIPLLLLFINRINDLGRFVRKANFSPQYSPVVNVIAREKRYIIRGSVVFSFEEDRLRILTENRNFVIDHIIGVEVRDTPKSTDLVLESYDPSKPIKFTVI